LTNCDSEVNKNTVFLADSNQKVQ